MEFLHEKRDYNVAEFFEHFHNDLPKTVMVNQGFCGEIVEDTFDREQVLRVNAISRQPRVIAKFQYGNHSKLISIPVAYEEKLCIVKHVGKRSSKLFTNGKPKSISNILKDRNLPITVQFPKDHEITVGNQTVSTNNIPNMELIQTFEEVYLLANFITDGIMDQEVVHVPLYLSRLRLAIITGIEGQSTEKWTHYQQELDRAAQHIEFDQEFGNPNIAEYDPSAIHTDTTYTFIEPKAYSNIVSLVNKAPLHSFDNTTYSKVEHEQDDGTNEYEEIDNTARGKYDAKEKHGKKKKSEDQAFKKELESAITHDEHKEGSPKPAFFKFPRTHKASAPPPLAPKPSTNIGNAPAVPERRAIPHVPQTTKSTNLTHVIYTNEVPRTSITPTVHTAEQNVTKAKHETKVTQEKPVRDVNSSDDIIKLSIDEVAHYLTKLKLEKYVEGFKSQLIDGAMLVDLDRDILREDFGMKAIEALRLLKFAKEGHLPN